MTKEKEKKTYHKRRGMSSRILDVLADGGWHSVQEISRRIGYLETGTSAGIRSLRKKPYGRKNVVGKWIGGVYHYRLEEGKYGEDEEQLEFAV
jgi:hypothetical protein|tara:strand:- start:29409 stop:29687 length:279 start_codon:yes stop_codon:yes gene_type:complete